MRTCDTMHSVDRKAAPQQSLHPVRSHAAPPNAAQPHHPSRRVALAAAILAACAIPKPAIAASSLPPPPPVGASYSPHAHPLSCNRSPGNCPECLGEIDDALNRCNFDAPSCVSVYNDDEEHFFAPWSFDLEPTAAADELVRVATGGGTLRGLEGGPFGLSRGAAASYILGGTAAVVTGAVPCVANRAGDHMTVCLPRKGTSGQASPHQHRPPSGV